jgi:hypothetical protein
MQASFEVSNFKFAAMFRRDFLAQACVGAKFSIQYCINECIFRAHFANIVAYAYTSCCAPCHVYMSIWICLDIASFPIVRIMCVFYYFVLMWYKKMPQC